MAKHTFVISDESVINAHGFRVMTAGINLAKYNTNPIVLWWHKRPNSYASNSDDEVMPIGLASNLRVEGAQLLADIEFDQDDDFARKIEKKVEKGFLRMCSPGLDPITVSTDEEYLLKGQKYATLVESDLIEISIADIGSNPNALKVQLYNSNHSRLNLSLNDNGTILPLVNTEKSKIKSMELIKRVATILALNPDSSEQSVMDALNGRLELAKRADSLKAENDTLKEHLKLANESRIINLVDSHVDKKFTADKRDQLIKLGNDSGFDTLKNVIDMMPDQVKPAGHVKLTNNPAGGGAQIEKFEDLLKLGREEVEKFRADNRPEYIKLFKAHYGVEPSFAREE